MSLYSSLRQVLAPYAAKLNGLLTGWDGTEYNSPGEAVRSQISALHVLIGDEPGTAIDASAIGYNDSNVEDALDGLNGRLDELSEVVESANVFNPDTAVEGYIIWISDAGKAHVNANSYLSDFIPVKAGDIVRYYRLTSNNTFYNTSGTNFSAIAEYADADENTFTAGATSTNPYTVQQDGFIRFCNPLTQLKNDKIVAVTINDELTGETITGYYVKTYPINNPQVEENMNKIAELGNNVSETDTVTYKGVTIRSQAFWYFPLLCNVRTDFYFQNRVDGMADKFLGFFANNATVHKDSVSVTPNDASTMQAIYLVGALNSQNNVQKNLFIPVKPVPTSYGNGVEKKVLLIGDSLTEIGKYQNYVNSYLETDGMTVEWLGSKTSGFGLKNEGRYGWRAYTYTHFAETTAADNEGTPTTNAFWNPSTNKFDFAYYMSQQGYSSVDIVFINLGTNDFARANHNTDDDVYSAWNEIITSIHSYDANIDIVLWMCPPACLMNGIGAAFSAIYQHYRMRKIIWDNWTSNQWGKNHVWIMPSHLCIDPVHGFPSHEVARNEYDSELVEEATDLTHLSDSGYRQLANPIIAMIKYIGSLS